VFHLPKIFVSVFRWF